MSAEVDGQDPGTGGEVVGQPGVGRFVVACGEPVQQDDADVRFRGTGHVDGVERDPVGRRERCQDIRAAQTTSPAPDLGERLPYGSLARQVADVRAVDVDRFVGSARVQVRRSELSER